jgi:hypothetical protein
MDYAIVNASGVIENVCIWDGVEPWSPCHPDDQVICIEGQSVGIGYVLQPDGTFVRPEPTVD